MQVFLKVQFASLIFLIYTNNLPEGFKSNPKLFDTSSFSVVNDVALSENQLNKDLINIKT